MNYFIKIIELPENILFIISNFIKDIRNQIIWAYQRCFRGYDDRIFWGISSQLSPMMVKIIDWYIKNQNGYPAILTNKKWNNILKQIKEGFEADIKIGNMNFDKKNWKKEWNKLEKKREKGLILFAKYYADIWD